MLEEVAEVLSSMCKGAGREHPIASRYTAAAIVDILGLQLDVSWQS